MARDAQHSRPTWPIMTWFSRLMPLYRPSTKAGVSCITLSGLELCLMKARITLEHPAGILTDFDAAHWIRNKGSTQFKAAVGLESARRWCLQELRFKTVSTTSYRCSAFFVLSLSPLRLYSSGTFWNPWRQIHKLAPPTCENCYARYACGGTRGCSNSPSQFLNRSM